MVNNNIFSAVINGFDDPDICWVLGNKPNDDGYIRVSIKGKKYMSHRAALMAVGVDIPNGYEVDHLCKNRACCNPTHLEVVTHLENMRRGDGMDRWHAAKTHCKRGHLFDEANTIRNKKGFRSCRECRRLYDRLRDAEPDRKLKNTILDRGWGK